MNTFSETYAEARQKFLHEAEQYGVVNTYTNPCCLGPNKESLCTDVLRIGSRNAENVLIVSSGVHGIEGFAGSASQIDLLQQGSFKTLPDNTAVLLVHGLNPYGFAFKRRTNENNVDLNRNFIDRLPVRPTEHPLTNKVQPLFNKGALCMAFGLMAALVQHGKKNVQGGVSQGQYSFSDGLFYGGVEAEWSNKTWRKILKQYTGGAKNIVHVDIHTGLGDFGDAELIMVEPEASEAYQRGREWWGNGVVSMLKEGDSSSSRIYGEMNSAVQDAAPNSVVTTMTLEFGTRPLRTVLSALIADNNAHVKDQQGTASYDRAKEKMTNAFYPHEQEWKERVIERGREVIAQAQSGLARVPSVTPPQRSPVQP